MRTFFFLSKLNTWLRCPCRLQTIYIPWALLCGNQTITHWSDLGMSPMAMQECYFRAGKGSWVERCGYQCFIWPAKCYCFLIVRYFKYTEQHGSNVIKTHKPTTHSNNPIVLPYLLRIFIKVIKHHRCNRSPLGPFPLSSPILFLSRANNLILSLPFKSIFH